ncbi:hypothetical protein [Saccharothrix carnea]|nr:hypothetical protein [Saccharothrix carnea]
MPAVNPEQREQAGRREFTAWRSGLDTRPAIFARAYRPDGAR